MSDFDLEYHLKSIAISSGPWASDKYDGKKSAEAVIDEFAKLREAVRVLGAELFKSERWKYAEMGGSLRRFDEDPVACTDESIRNNPIAAAAVRGEVKE